MAGGRLKSDAVYLGLTRPPMVFGVTYTYVVMNGMLCLITFIETNNVAYLVVMLPIMHLFGYYLCLKDPRMMDMFLLRCAKCMRCLNKYVRHFGNNSYDLF